MQCLQQTWFCPRQSRTLGCGIVRSVTRQNQTILRHHTAS